MRFDVFHSHPACSLGRTVAALLLCSVAGVALSQGAVERPDIRAAHERVARIEKAEGGDSLGLAAALLDLGVLLDSAGDRDDARAALERALSIREKALGKDHTATAVVLSKLGLVLQELGSLEGAHSALERSLAIRERHLGAEHAATIQAVDDLGVLMMELGDADGAAKLFARALASGDKVLGPRDVLVARYLVHLGEAQLLLGNVEPARGSLERALEIRERTLGHEHLETAESSQSLGELLYSTGEYVRALEQFESAFSTRAKLLPPNDPETAITRMWLGVVMLAEHRVEEAGSHLEHALAVCEAELGPDHPTTLRALEYMSALLEERGRPRDARALLQRVFVAQTKQHGGDHPAIAETLGRLASISAALGNPAEAESLLERAIAIRQHALGADDPRTVALALQLAELFHANARDVEAEPLYERSLALLEKRPGPDHPRTAVAMGSLARCLRAQSKISRAKPLFERALAVFETSLGDDHPLTCAALEDLGTLARAEGDLYAARGFLERTFAARTRVFGSEHPSTQRALRLFVLTLADAGERKAAWEQLSSVARAARDEHVRARWTLSEDGRLRSIAGRRAVIELCVAFVPEGSAADERIAYDAVREWKSALGASLLEKPALPRDSLAALQGVHAELVAELSRVELQDRAAHDRRVVELRERESALARASTEREIREGTRALPDGSVLVDFFVHDVYAAAELDGARVVTPGRMSEPRLLAWVTRAGNGSTVRVDLGPSHVVEQCVRAFLESLQTQRALSVATSVGRTAFEEASSRLLEVLWTPLKPTLGDARDVFVAPDRFLATLPLGTILQDDGSYLVERHRFVYVQDASALAENAPRTEPSDVSLLAVGNVDYDLRGERPAEDEAALDEPPVHGGPFQALRFSGREATVVSEIFASAHAGAKAVLQLRDGFATEPALERELKGRRFVHLATRGRFAAQPLPSLLESHRAPDPDDPFDDPGRAERLASGRSAALVCSGANAPSGESGDDGLISSIEIASLELSACDLAVVNGCQPSLGTEHGGEAAASLQRAFHAAGARTLVISLWAVDDAPSIGCMRGFYQRLWGEKLSKADALRDAQLEILRRNRNAHQGAGLPYTWGGFVLSGDWR